MTKNIAEYTDFFDESESLLVEAESSDYYVLFKINGHPAYIATSNVKELVKQLSEWLDRELDF